MLIFNAIKIRFIYLSTQKKHTITICCSHTLATLTATPLQIEHFSIFRVPAQSQRICSAFAMSLSAFAVELPTSKNFSTCSQNFFDSRRCLGGFVLQSPWVRSAFAINLMEPVLRLHCEPRETAVRLCQMHGDCAANHIRYNRNDVINCRGGVEDTRLEAKAKDTKKIRGQGQGQPFRGQTLSRPRTGMLEAKDQAHKRKCSPKKKKGLHKNFLGDLQKIKKSSQKFFKRSPQKNVF